ncbi:fungal-specific transcription factor domain-containing protein [Aspergillus californicus]
MAGYLDDPNQPQIDFALSQFGQNLTNKVPIESNTSLGNGESSFVPRPKRIACAVCRRRKLRCDGRKPSCGTCSRLGHECAYDEARKKSGPKRGYVKQLEARLAQVETMLKTQDPPLLQTQGPSFTVTQPDEPTSMTEMHALGNSMNNSISPTEGAPPASNQTPAFTPEGVDATNQFGWDMISLGLEEPFPAREVIIELNQIYFDKTHAFVPIIHRPRFMAAMDFAPNSRPPACLQYIVWAHAAAVSDKYANLHALFYQRARKYADLDQMKGLGENILSLSHCQTWLLIACYEYKMMFFPRAWLSTGTAARLAIMLGLHRLDGEGLEVKQCLPPARDWTEKEERRRVFWMGFAVDRYASIGTGWPTCVDERDILTNLPSSEEAFINGKPEKTPRLCEVLNGDELATLSPFAGVAFMSCLLGRNLTHLHRPDPQDNDDDLNGVFWQRHRSHDNILLHFALSMPSHLRLPAGITDSNVLFCNLAVHTSTICLHQAAIFKAEKNNMPEQIILESKRRCIVAADQISSIMKMVSSLDISKMNPFISFCVYVAARVFVQYLKFRPDDMAARSSLQFVFSVLDALKNQNPLTESFLVQLEVDIEGTPFQDIRLAANQRSSRNFFKEHSYGETAPNINPRPSKRQLALGGIGNGDGCSSWDPTMKPHRIDFPSLPCLPTRQRSQPGQQQSTNPSPNNPTSQTPTLNAQSTSSGQDTTPFDTTGTGAAAGANLNQFTLISTSNTTTTTSNPLFHMNTLNQSSSSGPDRTQAPQSQAQSVPSPWNFPLNVTDDPNDPSTATIDLMATDMDGFSGAQWAHILGSGNWNP